MPSRKERHALNALIDDMCAPFNRETNAILNEVAISKQNNGRGLHIVLGRKIGKMVGGLVREGRHLTKFTEDDEDAISHEAADIAALKEEETGRHFQTSGNTDFVDAETELALGRSTVLDEVRRWVKRSPSPPHGYGHHAVKVGDDVVLVHDYLGPSHDKVIVSVISSNQVQRANQCVYQESIQRHFALPHARRFESHSFRLPGEECSKDGERRHRAA